MVRLFTVVGKVGLQQLPRKLSRKGKLHAARTASRIVRLASWGCGGMADAADLKSAGNYSRVGSSPTSPIFQQERLPSAVTRCSNKRRKQFEINRLEIGRPGSPRCSYAQ